MNHCPCSRGRTKAYDQSTSIVMWVYMLKQVCWIIQLILDAVIVFACSDGRFASGLLLARC